MPARTSPRQHAPRRKRRSRTAAPVRRAAAAAVERVLKSDEAFRLLIRRLEAAGWRIERGAETVGVPDAAPATLTAPERAR